MAGEVRAQGGKGLPHRLSQRCAPLSALGVASLRRYRVRAMILAMRP